MITRVRQVLLFLYLCCATPTRADEFERPDSDDAQQATRPSNGRSQSAIRKLEVLGLHKESTAAVCFSRTGRLATSSRDQTVKFWDMKQRRVVATLKGLPRTDEGTWDRDAVFSPDGNLFATATTGGSLRVYETKENRELWRTKIGARSLAFAPDGKTLVTADWEDSTVKVWQSTTGKLLETLKGTTELVKPGCWSQGTVAYAPHGKSFATAVGGADQGVRFPTQVTIWDGTTLAPQAQFIAQTTRVHAMAYSPDGRTLAVGGVKGGLRLFRLPVPLKVKAEEAKVRQLIAQLNDEEFEKREAAQRELVELGAAARAALEETAKKSTAAEVRFRCRTILAAIVENAAPKLLATLEPRHKGTVMGIAFSPQGTLLASCSREYREGRGRIIVWRTTDMKRPVFEWDGPGVNSIQFSPDGKHMASSGQDGAVTLWQIDQVNRPER